MLDTHEARRLFRDGKVTPTAGWCAGSTQANLLAVPAEWAFDTLLFAQRNPRPCPILDITTSGSPRTMLAPDADLRTDLPLYRVWSEGELIEERTEVLDLWHSDLVAFLIGCSFTFEARLIEAGVPLRHVEQGRNVPMFVTNRPCAAAGRMGGPLVVSMRPVPSGLVDTAHRVTAEVPAVHGAPVHAGDPERIGIADLDRPDFGQAVCFEPGDVPVFWACGVTLQSVVMASRPPFALTHAPGHMFITDLPIPSAMAELPAGGPPSWSSARTAHL